MALAAPFPETAIASDLKTGRSSPDVRALDIDGREIVLLGTAHISRESADLVRGLIESERPDCVCVELDAGRYQALSQERRWESLDLTQVIRRKQLSTLLANLVLSSYQKRLGGRLGIAPGTELMEATRVAAELGIPVELCDRDVRVTLRRAARAISFFQKAMLFGSLFAGAFEKIEISEEELRRLRQQDVLSELIRELGQSMPALKRVLIDERDAYLAERIRRAPGRRVVVVVGAGHVEGICAALRAGRRAELEALDAIPPISPAWKWLGWSVPAVILGSLAAIAWRKGAAVAGDNLVYWILANGVPSSLGTALALGHPLTVIAAFCAAPLTSLTPVIGAGYVTAFVQAVLRPPLVGEFQSVSDDAGRPSGWWRNRLLRVMLVFLLSTLGSVIGTWLGAYEIVSNLF